VKTVTLRFERGADPERTIQVVFAHPDIEPRTFQRDEELTVHYLTYEHLEQLQ
jgi:hypothetical protein